MPEPESIENIPEESAGKGIPNGGNPAKTKEVRVGRHTADPSDPCSCFQVFKTFVLFFFSSFSVNRRVFPHDSSKQDGLLSL